LRPNLPRDLNTICLKCLEKELRHRYASALELAEDLGRYLHGELIHARAFTLMDRVARTLNRDQQVVHFHALGNLLIWLAPLPFLVHLLGFLLVRNGWPHVTALWLTFSMVVIVLPIFLWTGSFRNVFPSGPSLRDFWSIRIGTWLGIVLLPFLTYLMAAPDRSWEPLTTYPLWALMVGVTLFSLGSSFWGRLYVLGLILLVLSFVMTIQLAWAVLEFGGAMSLIFMSIALHLRRISTQKSKTAKEDNKDI
jgi:hypothetical protein